MYMYTLTLMLYNYNTRYMFWKQYIPRDPSTSSKGTWTLQTHPKHLLRGYLDP